MNNKLLTGIKTLNELRVKAASLPTGMIKVSIEELNKIADEIDKFSPLSTFKDYLRELIEQGWEISFSKHV